MTPTETWLIGVHYHYLFLPYGFEDIIDGSSNNSESKAFDLMVEHDDNIAAVKAYTFKKKR